jgi:DHA1 family bicyclomycin/chloramphenicol resistance-like MFS transporter
MKHIQEKNQGIVTIISFALIPLSGFATDVYLPSLPSMASAFHVSGEAIQASLLIFLVSGGLSQLFVGSLLDSFGRYRLSTASLIVFSIASFIITQYPNIYVLYSMRIVHGITVAIIVVSKRAYFLDTFKGDQLKNYTSLFSIIWATAPIIAPFIGGYLQSSYGWEANFYFLGILTLVILAFDLIFGGESLKQFQRFKARPILNVYASMLKTGDYVLGLLIIALSYSMLIVFGMTSPFIIEHLYHYSPVVTGYGALLSGVALMSGGIISKSMLSRPLDKKIPVAIGIQFAVATGMIAVTHFYAANIYTLLLFVLLLNVTAGFIFNNLFAYSLGRFSGNAGILSGFTGGGMFVITSILSYGVVNALSVKNQELLSVAYLALICGNAIAFTLFQKYRYQALQKPLSRLTLK